MFSTYFYIFILIFQLFISDNAGYYNQNIVKINQLIEQKDYQKAYFEIKRIEKYLIFNNHELNKVKILISLKLNIGIKELIKNKELDVYQWPIVLSKIGKTKEALVFLKRDIIENNNDSLIKLYEIYSQKRGIQKKQSSFNTTLVENKKTIDNVDALALLDLMKKKEKFLAYKNNVE